jgi:hypothetical protein
MIDGSAAIHSHNLGLLIMLRGISNTGPFGQAKQCVINALDTQYLLYADEVMAKASSTFHKTWTRKHVLRIRQPPTHQPLPSSRLSLLVAARTAVEDTTHVVLVVFEASQTSAALVAA